MSLIVCVFVIINDNNNNNNNNNNNELISKAPLGRNFRDAGGSGTRLDVYTTVKHQTKSKFSADI